MDRNRWLWLVQQTGEDTTRGIARECGVSHTTVQRWLSKGIPVPVLADLVCRLNADPLEAWMAWGFIGPEHVEGMNWEALAQYMPLRVLLAEVHRREADYVKVVDDRLRRQVSPVATMPLRLHGLMDSRPEV